MRVKIMLAGRAMARTLGLAALLAVASLGAQFEVDGAMMYNVLPVDAIPAILEPKFVSGKKADRIMRSDEQVIGIVGPGGTAVAYSTWHLDRHEIVNDVVDGVALAVTW